VGIKKCLGAQNKKSRKNKKDRNTRPDSPKSQVFRLLVQFKAFGPLKSFMAIERRGLKGPSGGLQGVKGRNSTRRVSIENL